MPPGRSVSDDELIELLKTSRDPVLTAEDVGRQVGLGTRHARERLLELARDDDQPVVTKDVGRARIFYHAELLEYRDHRIRELQGEQQRRQRRQDVVELVADLELPGRDGVVEDRRQAVLAAVDTIAERGTATRSDILDRVDELAGYGSPLSLWKNAIEPSLRTLRQDVDELDVRGSTWRWVASAD